MMLFVLLDLVEVVSSASTGVWRSFLGGALLARTDPCEQLATRFVLRTSVPLAPQLAEVCSLSVLHVPEWMAPSPGLD